MKTLAFSLLTVIMISLGPLSCPTFGQIEKIFELQQGVVVDLGRGLMFVMNPKGGIDAIDIGKGTLVWHSNEAAKPLILQGDLLICQGEPAAQTNVLDIVILQTQQNGGRKSAFAINLPQSVQVSIDERLTDTFIVGAHLFGDKVVISWEYKPRPEWARGVRDTSVSNMPSRRNSVIRGTFRLDPSTGATSHLPTERISPSVGGQILKTSERLTEVVGPQYFSANANHILGTKKIANSSEWNKYRWTIYSRTDGKKIGEVGMHVSWAPFFALDSTIICRTPPYSRLINGKLVSQEARVRAINLRTGNEIWSWPIRDTKFRGPFPN
ncbi:MAG TPA: hypothetical protein VLX91_01805 [Candidatus Acidoferrales bacterium]|nr:hypothetical protein [Candidatus Acidoferrales bacterium]